MLAEILPKVAGMEREEWKYSPRPSANDQCIRALVYHALGIPRKRFPGRAVMVLDDSSWHETLTGDWIQKTAYRLHSEQMEVECYEVAGKVVKGHIDGILTDLLEIDRLYEHKALNHFSFQRIWNGEMPLGYIGQCCSYLGGLQKLDKDITEALLLVKNKNTAQYLEIQMAYDGGTDNCCVIDMVRSTGEAVNIRQEFPKIVADIVAKFEQVEQFRAKKELPERPYTFAESSAYPCSYCGWGDDCWGSYVSEIEALETNVALDEELETLAGYYLETSMHIDEMKAEKDERRRQIIDALRKRGVAGGRAGGYSILLSMTNRSTLDQSKIPAAILAEAKIVSTSERLSIRKAKA